MNNTDQIYTTYIRTTPEKLWQAITNPEFTRQYWGEHANISSWKKGAKWQHEDMPNKTVRVQGEVVECIPPKKLVLTWALPGETNDVSRVTFEIEKVQDLVRLDVTHGNFKAGSEMAGKVSKGWPLVLSSLKSFLETDKPIDILAMKGCNSAENSTEAA